MANLVNLVIASCSEGTGCGDRANPIEVEGIDFLLPEGGATKPLMGWITIRKNGSGKKGEFRAPLTTRVRASKINGRPVPDLQLYFEEQLEEPVGGVRASCGDRVDYVRGIACVIE